MILDTKAKSRQKASGPSGPSTLIICTIGESDTTVKTLHLEPVVRSNHSSFTYYVNFKWILATNSCPEVPLRHDMTCISFGEEKSSKPTRNSQFCRSTGMHLPRHLGLLVSRYVKLEAGDQCSVGTRNLLPSPNTCETGPNDPEIQGAKLTACKAWQGWHLWKNNTLEIVDV